MHPRGRLSILVTSPRLPAGLLTPAAWAVIGDAELVLAASEVAPLSVALRHAGVDVAEAAAPTAADLLSLAVDRRVVWLPDDGAAQALTAELAAEVVARAGAGDADGSVGGVPDIEVVVGSFDPPGAALLDAVAVMDRLRAECPWDREQTHESLVTYLVEETYEVIEAIESGDGRHLREELGDLLLQVLFHARLAEEDADDPFTVDDVAQTLVDKLVRRHPHVFADVDVAGSSDVEANWERIKQQEKGRRSPVEGIPPGLPALSLAQKVVGRALAADVTLSVPVPSTQPAYTEEGLGEVLFALVAAAQAGGLDAERALRTRVRREVAALQSAADGEEAPVADR